MDNLSLEDLLDHLESLGLQLDQEDTAGKAKIIELRKLKRRIKNRTHQRKRRGLKMPSSTKKERKNGKGFVFAEKFGADGATAHGQEGQQTGESSLFVRESLLQSCGNSSISSPFHDRSLIDPFQHDCL